MRRLRPPRTAPASPGRLRRSLSSSRFLRAHSCDFMEGRVVEDDVRPGTSSAAQLGPPAAERLELRGRCRPLAAAALRRRLPAPGRGKRVGFAPAVHVIVSQRFARVMPTKRKAAFLGESLPGGGLACRELLLLQAREEDGLPLEALGAVGREEVDAAALALAQPGFQILQESPTDAPAGLAARPVRGAARVSSLAASTPRRRGRRADWQPSPAEAHDLRVTDLPPTRPPGPGASRSVRRAAVRWMNSARRTWNGMPRARGLPRSPPSARSAGTGRPSTLTRPLSPASRPPGLRRNRPPSTGRAAPGRSGSSPCGSTGRSTFWEPPSSGMTGSRPAGSPASIGSSPPAGRRARPGSDAASRTGTPRRAGEGVDRW